jgi:hypothetical protein
MKLHPLSCVGYAYDSNIHCVTCARSRFGVDALRSASVNDSEGNIPQPVFDADHIAERGDGCATCGGAL